MSYLNPPRLHFAGRFQAAPSTVNNDPLHFDNAAFVSAFQRPQDRSGMNGWWNPAGDAAWRLIGCRVTTALVGHEEKARDTDPIGTCLVSDSDRAPPAKIVDLDPEQQLVSEVWGLEVRIALPDGTNLLRGRYAPAAFADIWDRAVGGGGDVGAGAMYQSVLTDLEWGDVSASAFLTALEQAARNGLLSIKFNVDGYNMDAASPEFTRGRIVGTIGPAAADEPRHFVVGRHFMAAAGSGGNFFKPGGGVNYCVAVIDEAAGKIVLDLGNALPTVAPGGPASGLGTLALGYLGPPTSAGGGPPILLGVVPYTDPDWYGTTAGVISLPTDRVLTPDESAAIGQSPLALTLTGYDGTSKVAIAEAPTGCHVRADRFVFRLNPGDRASVRLFASRWGKPYAGARIVSILDPSQLQPASSLGPAPPVAVPAAAVDFPARIVADGNGVAELAIRAFDPGRARGFLDGQVYGVRPAVEENLAFGASAGVNQWEFVSLLVWSGFAADEAPAWHGSIEPILTQYSNLYPVMKPIVDLADYESVCANSGILRLAFGLPVEHPNSMPVTRDLSDAKRMTILRWLSETGPDGKPLKGTPAPTPAMAAAIAARGGGRALPDLPLRGGKAAAAARRLVLKTEFY